MQTQVAEGFIVSHHLGKDGLSLREETQRFLDEMQRGLRGDGSSLYMLPTFLSAKPKAHLSGTSAVLDAGGTNLRSGTVTFVDGRVTDITAEKRALPGTKEELSVGEFFSAIAQVTKPHLQESRPIGFCFSCAAQCCEDGDGKLLSFCKEVRVRGAEGKFICKELKSALGDENRLCLHLNDTAAAMLGGMADGFSADEPYCGFILGTGTNCCYGEKTKNIEKYTGTAYAHDTMIVNMESGMYEGFPRGDLDEILDKTSEKPRDHMAEKLVSGVYLGKLLYLALARAKEEGLFSGDLSAFAGEIPMAVWQDLSFARGEDTAFAKEIISALYGRTARMMTIVLSAVALQTGASKGRPLNIVMEGSTYGKSPLLQKLLQEELSTAGETFGLSFRIVTTEHATLKGAALAALSAQ